MLNLRSVVMKKIVMASAVMAATAMAGGMDSRPEASVPTPVESRETLNKVSNMSEKENADWQKLREERRAAREQILKNLRESSAAAKNEIREASVKVPEPEKPTLEKPVPETPVLEKPIEKNIDKPKNEFVREKKQEEKELLKGPWGNQPLGPSVERPGNKKVMDPMHPMNPHQREKNPKEPLKPIMPVTPKGWNKG